MSSSYSFKDNLTIDNNKYLKWLDITGTSRANIISLDNVNNVKINSAFGNLILNSESVSSYTFLNVNGNASGVIIGSKMGIGFNTTTNMNSILTLNKNNFIGINTTTGSNDGYLGLSGTSSLNTTGSRIILYGNESSSSNNGKLNLYAGNTANGTINLFTADDKMRLQILNNGTLNVLPDGITSRLIINDTSSTFTNNVILASGTASTNATTGALTVSGGMGITGSVYILGSLSLTTTSTGNLNFSSSNPSTSYSSGAVVLTGGMGISSTVNATSVTSGGGISIAGGVAIAKDVYVGGKFKILDSTVATSSENASVVLYGGLGINSNILSRTDLAPQIKLAPTTDRSETSISFYSKNNFSETSNTGSSWRLGQNVNSVSSGNFALANSQFGNVLSATYSGNISILGNVYIDSQILKVPVGTNAQRPASAQIGFIRYNSDTDNFEGYGTGSTWGSLGGGGGGVTGGNLIVNSINLGVSNMFSGSFTPNNNQSIASNVTGLSFNNSDIRYFIVNLTVSITRTTGGNLYESFTLEGNQNNTLWELLVSSVGDSSGFVFTITSLGQIQYTSTNITNYSNSILRYNVNEITNTGTYSRDNLETQGTLITNSIQVLNTQDAISGVNNGALYVAGGVTIDKTANITNIIATNETIGILNVTGLTAGNINFTGSLYQNGSAYMSSQWTSIDSNTDIYFGTSANSFVGIGTTTPGFNLDISGGSRITGGLTVGNLNVNTGATITNILNTTICTGTVIITAGSLNAGFNSNTLGNIFTTGGNVGIGFAAPQFPLQISNANATGGIHVTVSSNKTFGSLMILDRFGGGTMFNVRADGFVTITTSLTTGSVYSTNITSTNIVGTNISSATLNLSTGLTSASAQITNLNVTTATIPTLLTTNAVATNISVGTVSANTFTGGSLSLSGNLNVAGTLTTVNITSTNLVNTNVSAGIVVASTLLSATGNSNTVGNIFTTGGNVGIGTTSPSRLLSLSGPNSNSVNGPHIWINTSDSPVNPVFQQLNWSANNVSLNFDMYYDGFFKNSNSSTAWQIYKLGNQMKFMYQNGTAGSSNGQLNAMVLGSTGNVGIGTTSPSESLDVRGNLRIGNSTQGNYISFYGTSGDDPGNYNHTYVGERKYSGTESSELLLFKGNDVAGSTGPDRIRLLASNHVFDTYTSALSGTFEGIGTSGTTRMLIDNNGNVGIGTTSPGSALHVNGTIGALPVGTGVHMGTDFVNNASIIQINQGGSTTGLSIIDFGYSGNNYVSRIVHDNNDKSLEFLVNSGTIAMTLSSSGNVGIGNTNPGAKLDVNGTTLNRGGNAVGAFSENQQLFGWSGSTTGAYMHAIKTRHNGGGDDIHNALDFYVWQTSDAVTSVGTKHVMSATSVGVGIGTTSPRYTLDVNGTLEASNSNGLMLFASSGNVGIGTTSPGGILHLNNAALFTSSGDLTCTGDIISFGSLSDRRLKKDIEPISLDKAIDVVSRLRSVKFKWREDIFNESKRNTNDIGFIAQEIEDIIPEAVSEYKDITSDELYKNIKYEKIIPYLLVTMQYLLDKINI